MVLKIYGHPQGTCTQRVAAVCYEKRVPFEFIEVDWVANEHKSPAFLEKQPFGKMPYIDDDGFILFESRAICRYIATKWASQGTSLIPTDLKELAYLEQAANVEAFNFDAPVYGAAQEKLFKPAILKLPTDEARLAEYHAKAEEVFKAYDVILSKHKYIAGDKLTVVDLYHLPYGELFGKTGNDAMLENSNVARWWNEISSRPSWLAVKDGIKSVAEF